jgi:methionyl aminopeptidase
VIILKSAEELALMRAAGRVVGRVLGELRSLVKPGVETRELDAYAESRARALGAAPAFKGYRGYPASLCVSVDAEVIHGLPSARRLREGEIVSLDFGVRLEGFYADAAVTVPVGAASSEALRLVGAAERSFEAGIAELRDGARLSDVSAAIQRSVEAEGFAVIRQFVGHGIGRALHEDPQVPNFGAPGRGPRLRPGLTMALEPMIAAGSWEVDIQGDGWTAVTRDGRLAAHHEHTVALTEAGVELLTAPGEDARPAAGREDGRVHA